MNIFSSLLQLAWISACYFTLGVLGCGLTTSVWAVETRPTRCEIIPLPDDQVSMQIEGIEKTRWHFDSKYPRPFFYPLVSPDGATLTRMGHPGASNHDHHRSVWFAHNKVDGFDFWSEQGKTQIRQKLWYDYRDGDEEAILAVACEWLDPTGRVILEQELVAALRPELGDEHALELQITLRPGPQLKTLELEKTNFGLLAVRVAKSLSTAFGDGVLTNDNGIEHEANLFAKPSKWMDYSGSVAIDTGPARRMTQAGITYYDHPSNPRYPSNWHVREDGWMGASFCLDEGFTLKSDSPLVLRYLLYCHRGLYNEAHAVQIHKSFAERPMLVVEKSKQPHRQFEVKRVATSTATQQPRLNIHVER